ncbi:MAG: phosphotransferase family protein, partial [Mycobacterium sp.]
GLGDLGRPNGFHERQVQRWSSQLSSYQGRELPGIDEVMIWLQGHLPGSFIPTIMHGDFHMTNVLIARDRPGRVLAILDWETTTIGDPLLDLAGFCEIWCSVAGDGFPGRDALVERYATVRDLADLDDLDYYNVLYNFRMAVLLEGIYQRSLVDLSRPAQELVGERALFNLRRAVELTQAGM